MTNNRLPVTLLVGTYNSADLLPECISSCSSWVSEIVAVDMESHDDTQEIASRLGARVVSIPNVLHAVEQGRQIGIDAATQPWVAILDADERFRPGMREVVAELVAMDDLAGVWLPRQNIVLGRWLRHGGFWPDYQMRLFRRDAVRWPARIHAVPEVTGRSIYLPSEELNSIIHLHGQTVSDWMAKINAFTDSEAVSERDEGRSPSLWRLAKRPFLSFYRRYLRRGGFRDGMPGLAVALILAMYNLMVELKIWDLDRRQGANVAVVVSASAGAPPEPRPLDP